ncbi:MULTISPECIES: tyrosine-type recombinase/integrase [unclassified Streptomyces]|uniref:tyrosine-type recombinase/integrase n=1 Tax=unclassified Streptomyces TaxID=2593676 RepID=UPI0011538C26|nr:MULTISPECIES: site-specific integrase [unclassified Streptomyces]MCX5370137.1 site-specific integrase [Streptomyces sp. NBC_00103]TQJ52839.1 site-specific recombinase XerD [Streptomyces sp. SLBN-115]
MHLIYFSREGWESWGLSSKPLVRAGMPVLIDDDLLFEDAGVARPTVVVNQWLQNLPLNGAPAQKTWKTYAQAMKPWLEYLTEVGVHPFADRETLRAALSSFSEYRFSGPLSARWDVSTWNQNVNTVARFYQWAVEEGYCTAVPFTYALVRRFTEAGPVETRRNTATLRTPKPHVTMKYLEDDFLQLFLWALAGLGPGGVPDTFRGRQVGRNAAMAKLVVSSGPRAQEFTHLLTYELPTLPTCLTTLPLPFPLSAQITKGKKARETWVDVDAAAEMWQYVDLDRAASCHGRVYRPRDPLHVTEPDWEGGRINGHRQSWRKLTLEERLRLVTPEGTPAVLALQADGTPFTDWGTVFRRTSERIRRDFEPRFPIVTPHTLRHTFAMRTLEKLVKGYYQRAAALVADTHSDAALALYLTKHDPMLVLRDLMGHTSVTTTEIYVARLDVQRIYRDFYRDIGATSGLMPAEVDSEFERESDAAW